MSTSLEPLKLLGLIALDCPGLKPGDFASLVSSGVDPAELFVKADGLPPELAALSERACATDKVTEAEKEILRLAKAGIRVAIFGSPEYPANITQLYEPPIALFYRGQNLSLLDDKVCVSIVGARKADQIGCDIARDFAFHVAEAGGCVVSGLAYGIDAHAHLGALHSKETGSTAAVLGNGLEFGIYPSAHKKLAHNILDQGGLLLSQFPPFMKPFPSNFLDRNRVIAGLSKATLIIQAAERSGALATARHALDLGREVLVIPGAIGDERYVGSNRLIKQGAYLVSEIDDLFALVAELKPQKNSSRNLPSAVLSELQNKIQEDLMQHGAIHYDELLRTYVDAGALASAIDGLDETKLITRLPGNFISVRKKI